MCLQGGGIAVVADDVSICVRIWNGSEFGPALLPR